MIYTLNLTPALDYTLDLNEFNIGSINKPTKENITIGGKGINVSLNLNSLGVDSTILTILAGFTGQYLKQQLDLLNIKNECLFVDGLTRINVKIRKPIETAINANSPKVSIDDFISLINKNTFVDGDYICICGNLQDNIYLDAFNYLKEKTRNTNVKFIIDVSKPKSFFKSLELNPFLVKPNLEELEGLFNVKLSNNIDICKYAKELIKLGAQNVIVSLGDNGAILVNKEICLHAKTRDIEVYNTVGCGDALVTGFLYKYIKTNDIIDSFKFAICSGTYKASCNNYLNLDEITKFLNDTKLNYI